MWNNLPYILVLKNVWFLPNFAVWKYLNDYRLLKWSKNSSLFNKYYY